MIDDILIGISLILTFFAFVNNKKREYINSENFCLKCKQEINTKNRFCISCLRDWGLQSLDLNSTKLLLYNFYLLVILKVSIYRNIVIKSIILLDVLSIIFNILAIFNKSYSLVGGIVLFIASLLFYLYSRIITRKKYNVDTK